MRKAPILTFDGEFSFLSNFYESEMEIDQGPTKPPVVVKTLEHAYQALKAKTKDECDWVLASPTPGVAKRRGQKVDAWDNWEELKADIMLELLRIKFFFNENMRQRLLATGTARLVEGNTWGDRYWGVCRGEGENTLGMLLMQVRSELLDGTMHSTFRGLEFADSYYTEC
ncbi:hypothetical protein [Bacteriophage Eos]|nr:hypothetical protein [Bacteriophage Eos]